MTYSIIARDAATGELGVGVQSHFFNAGVHAVTAEAGVGVVASQMMLEPAYRTRALDDMRRGSTAAEALDRARAMDPGSAMRQVAVLDAHGGVAAFTGTQCVAHSAHCVGEGVSAQAAMCVSLDIPRAMMDAYCATPGRLAERLLAALDAAQAAGGDLRGQKAAALIVVAGSVSAEPWRDRLTELHVEEHPRPLEELRRLLGLHRFYTRANRALDQAMAGGITESLAEYAALEAEDASDPDVALRHAIVLALAGDAQHARARLEPCYRLHDGWRQVVANIVDAGLLPNDPAVVDTLLDRVTTSTG